MPQQDLTRQSRRSVRGAARVTYEWDRAFATPSSCAAFAMCGWRAALPERWSSSMWPPLWAACWREQEWPRHEERGGVARGRWGPACTCVHIVLEGSTAPEVIRKGVPCSMETFIRVWVPDVGFCSAENVMWSLSNMMSCCESGSYIVMRTKQNVCKIFLALSIL